MWMIEARPHRVSHEPERRASKGERRLGRVRRSGWPVSTPPSARRRPEVDPTVSDGESYACWTPRPKVGTFSIRVEPRPGQRPEDMLAREREGGHVIVEADNSKTEGAWLVRRLRYRASRTRPRTTRRDPRTRTIEHDEGGAQEWLVAFTFWRGGNYVAQVGFRGLVSAEPEIPRPWSRSPRTSGSFAGLSDGAGRARSDSRSIGARRRSRRGESSQPMGVGRHSTR